MGINNYELRSKEAADTIMEAFKEASEKKVSVGKTITVNFSERPKQFELSVSKKSDGNYLLLSREVLSR